MRRNELHQKMRALSTPIDSLLQKYFPHVTMLALSHAAQRKFTPGVDYALAELYYERMNLRTYIMAMPKQERELFAFKVGTTLGHLHNMAYGIKPCSAKLAVELEKASRGALRCEDLSFDVDWAYVRRSGRKS